jgi:MYXO-CTERM domain-containing protein
MTLAVILIFFLPAPEAQAEVCGAVGGQVECLDAQTLGWCDQGKLETITCPVGEICTNHEVFDGGYGCIPIADTACGDIPIEGMCTSGNTVVWCDDQGDLQLKACDDGTACGWNENDGWYDCLPGTMSNTAQTEPEDSPEMPWDTSLDTVNYDGSGGGGQSMGPIPDSVLNREPDGGPTPNVSAGGGSAGPTQSQETGGCGLAPGSDSWFVALSVLLLALIRRRVSHDLHGGRAA